MAIHLACELDPETELGELYADVVSEGIVEDVAAYRITGCKKCLYDNGLVPSLMAVLKVENAPAPGPYVVLTPEERSNVKYSAAFLPRLCKRCD